MVRLVPLAQVQVKPFNLSGLVALLGRGQRRGRSILLLLGALEEPSPWRVLLGED